MCALALPFVANQWLHLALGEALRPRLWWLVPVLLRRVPSTSQHWTEFAAVTVGTLGGVVVAAILWGRPQRSRGVAVRDTALTALAAVGIVAAVWWGLFRPVASRARVSSCLSNQKSLGLAFLLYAQDYDDRLPPGRTSLELLGLDGARYRHALRDPLADPLSEALGGGPMDTYSKNHQVWFCPADGTRRDWRGRLIRSADPGPAVSYVWHASLAGRRVETIRTPSEEWLLRDREPWHNGRRVLVFVDGHAARDTGP
jgi:prepilin-type processing-associated H-X9-DG protein